MKALHVVTYILIIVGALNWGLVGLFDFNLVSAILGDMSGLSRVVYALVGISAVVDIVTHKKNCCGCGGDKCDCKSCDSACDCGHDHEEEAPKMGGQI